MKNLITRNKGERTLQQRKESHRIHQGRQNIERIHRVIFFLIYE